MYVPDNLDLLILGKMIEHGSITFMQLAMFARPVNAQLQ